MFSSVARLFVVCLVAGVCCVSAIPKQHCGEALTQIMSIVCNSGSHTGFYKRSGRVNLMKSDDRPFYESLPFALKMLDTLVAERHAPNGVIEQRVRRNPGMNDYYVQNDITDECCDQPCSYDTMASYCGSYI